MAINLPSRYEDLSEAYKGRLVPNPNLISIIIKASKSMAISKGIRFLPVYGESGSGKSSASREISTHLPSTYSHVLSRDEIESSDSLDDRIKSIHERNPGKVLIFVIDQYEENVQGRENIPTEFVEKLSLLDRGELRSIPAIFLWLTTSKDFRNMLVAATSRNKRILLDPSFDIIGPDKKEWGNIIQETFSFHNAETPLADFGIIKNDLIEISYECSTIGECIELVGNKLGENIENLQNISECKKREHLNTVSENT